MNERDSLTSPALFPHQEYQQWMEEARRDMGERYSNMVEGMSEFYSARKQELYQAAQAMSPQGIIRTYEEWLEYFQDKYQRMLAFLFCLLTPFNSLLPLSPLFLSPSLFLSLSLSLSLSCSLPFPFPCIPLSLSLSHLLSCSVFLFVSPICQHFVSSISLSF